MMLQQLKVLYRARPFRPFTLRMVDGQVLPVESPEYVAFSRSGRTIAVHLRKDVLRIVEVVQVVSLVVPPPPVRQKKSAKSRKGKG